MGRIKQVSSLEEFRVWMATSNARKVAATFGVAIKIAEWLREQGYQRYDINAVDGEYIVSW